MNDVFDAETRSRVMKTVKSRNNKTTELRLIKLFNENHVTGWRRNYPVNGRPDFVFMKIKLALFVDGCFWHGHDCRNTKPKWNYEYWSKKISRNKKRDIEVTKLFQSRGWSVIRIWECQLTVKKAKTTIDNIVAEIHDMLHEN